MSNPRASRRPPSPTATEVLGGGSNFWSARAAARPAHGQRTVSARLLTNVDLNVVPEVMQMIDPLARAGPQRRCFEFGGQEKDSRRTQKGQRPQRFPAPRWLVGDRGPDARQGQTGIAHEISHGFPTADGRARVPAWLFFPRISDASSVASRPRDHQEVTMS